MDDVIERGELFGFRSLPRIPWRLRLRRMTPENSSVTVDTDAVRVKVGTWSTTISFQEIATARVTEWQAEVRIGVHYLRLGRWKVSIAPEVLATLDLDSRVTPVTLPRASRIDLGLTDPERFVSCVKAHIGSGDLPSGA